jgi:hypothetical protein
MSIFKRRRDISDASPEAAAYREHGQPILEAVTQGFDLRELGQTARCFHSAALKLKSLRRVSGRRDVNRTIPSIFTGLNPLQPKPASSALDRVSLVPTVDPWALRSGPPVSVALAGSAGFQVSAPDSASADRYVVGCDFLGLTFYFSFAGLYCWW